MKIIQTPSQNLSLSGYKKIGVQIHKTLGLMPWTLKWLQNPKSNASAHYLVAKNGDVYQLVQLKNRSWSAGRISRPNKRGRAFMKKGLNGDWIKPGYYTIEIEVECLLHEDYTEAQYISLLELFKTFDFKVDSSNFLTHQDTCWYKPNLEKERTEILSRLNITSDIEKKKKMQEMIVVLLNKLIQLYRRLYRK